MTKRKILVVEDENIVGLDLKSQLTNLGYEVPAVVASGEEAVHRILALSFDLALIDIHLKGEMDGVETAKKIKDSVDIPVIFLTAYSDDETLQRAKLTSPFGYILKPFEARELHTSIEMALYRHQMEKRIKESERWLSTTLNSIRDAVIATNAMEQIQFMNPAAEALTGWSREEALGKPLSEVFRIVSEESQAPCLCTLEKIIQQRGCVIPGEQPLLIAKTGAEIPIENRAAPIQDEHGKVLGAVITIRDITEQRQAAEALRLSEERYALAARGANDGLWDWDLKTDRIYFSERWKAMLGLTDHEIDEHPEEWFRLIYPGDQDRFQADIEAHLAGETPHLESEARVRTASGEYRWMLIRGMSVRDTSGKAYRMCGSLTDITDRKAAEERLRHDALHDMLTGLANRNLFMDRLSQALERATRYKDFSFAVLFMDLDRFKSVNDTFGHAIGDQVLVSVSRRLEVCLRSLDTVARLGGDEFIILLNDTQDVKDAINVAERINQSLAAPFELNENITYLSTSIGIVMGSYRMDDPEAIMRDADIAMYHAKSLGKGRYAIFDTFMRSQALSKVYLETELRRALEQNQFRVYYQPVVSLDTRTLVGFESLLRWQHPKRGLLSPGEFIALAEETGLIVPIDHWVIHNACLQLKQWQAVIPEAQHLTVSVNLSAQHFYWPDMVPKIESILQETGLAAPNLILDLTENILMEEDQTVLSNLSRLQTMGIHLEVDDFGTGYSSFNYLHRFPIDALKIDRSFVGTINRDGGHSEIVRTIIFLAQSLDMKLIAEGVETDNQMNQIKLMGCKFGQGFLFSKPLSEDKAFALIEQMAGGEGAINVTT